MSYYNRIKHSLINYNISQVIMSEREKESASVRKKENKRRKIIKEERERKKIKERKRKSLERLRCHLN